MAVNPTQKSKEVEDLSEVIRPMSKPDDLQTVAKAFIAYYTKGGSGCSNCGGVPHMGACFVKRFEEALGIHRNIRGEVFTDDDLKRAGQDWGKEP